MNPNHKLDPVMQISQCHGKHRFDSHAQATEGVSNRLKKLAAPYHCVHCGGWHVGGQEHHRRKTMARRKIREKKQNVE